MKKHYPLLSTIKVFLLCSFLFTLSQVFAQWQTTGPYGGNINSLAVKGSYIFAGTNAGVFVSANYGNTWSVSNTGLPIGGVGSIKVSGNNIFAIAHDGNLFSSDNNGASWTTAGSGFPAYSATVLATSGTNIFAGTSNKGIYLSTNNGQNWAPVNNTLPANVYVSCIAADANLVIISTRDSGIFSSVNNGTTWIRLDSGRAINYEINDMKISGPNIFAAVHYQGVFLSSDNGMTWSPINTGLRTTLVRELAIVGSTIFAGRDADSLFYTTNNGASWSTVGGFGPIGTDCMAVDGTNIFAGTSIGGVFFSGNSGTTWKQVNNGLIAQYADLFAKSGSKVFTGCNDGLYVTTNNGASWSAVDSLLINKAVTALGANGPLVVVGTFNSDVMISLDNGNTWIQKWINNGIQNLLVGALAFNGNNIFAGTSQGVYLSADTGATWARVDNGMENHPWVYSMTVKGNAIFAGTIGSGVYVTTNNGANWIQVNNGLTNLSIAAMAANSSYVFAATNAGFLRSDDNGASWKKAANGLTGASLSGVACTGSHVFASTHHGIWVSTDDGNKWKLDNTGLGITNIDPVMVTASDIFIGTNGGGVWQRSITDLIPCSAYFKLHPDTLVPHHWFALNQATGTSPITYTWTWGDGSSPSTGPTPSHTYSDSGYYQICLTITDGNSCTSTYCDSSTFIRSTNAMMIKVDVVTELPASIGEVEKISDGFSVYPNPASNRVTIETTGTGEQQLQVYDITGKQIISQLIQGNKTAISTAELAAGMYLVCIKNSVGIATRKLIIEK